MVRKPRSLRGRLAVWYAAILCVVLVAFAGTVYLVMETEEAQEPPEVAALEPPDQTGRHILVALAAALPTALLIAVGGGLWISRRALASLENVVQTAGTLGAESLAQRIQIRPGEVEEVARLGAALNGMLERLERSVNGMRRFTADASHELRTPIAVLMGELEVTLRRPREPAELRATMEGTLEELVRLGRLVDSLLVLARSDSGQLSLELAEVDAAEVTRRVLEPYEAVLTDRGIAFDWSCGARVLVRADPLWLGRAVANLVDNAAKFTPSGGRIGVNVATAGARAQIVVQDSGPGISAEERARIFERFYRGKAVRAGTEGFGLGLALARDIVRACGGELRSAEREGPGAEFRIELPAAIR